MSRVFGVWPISLSPGISEDDFERFMREDFAALWADRFAGRRGMAPILL